MRTTTFALALLATASLAGAAAAFSYQAPPAPTGPVAATVEPSSARMPLELLRPHFVEIGGGRRLNFKCVGFGSPTVVFEQGGEGFLTNWKKVQPAVSALTRTCVYDRAGFGYSDPPNKPVTGLNVTDDLRALLQRAGVADRILLVGHSIGGFYATLYADRFPDQVAGLVMVDAGFAGQERALTREQQQRQQANVRRGEGYLLHCAEMARAGRLTPENLSANDCVPVWPGSTPEERPYLLHAILRPHWHLAEHSQSVHYFPSGARPSVSWRQATEAHRPLGDLPIVALSAGVYPTEAWETKAEARAAQAHWQGGHKELAARSTRGRWAVVPGAGHFIQTDKPEAVIGAIREVVAEVRGKSVTAAGDGMMTLQDGRKLHLRCQGAGSPTVVLDAGLGLDASVWSRVLPDLARTTRTCAYDRAGYGRSDPGAMPRDKERLAGDLLGLLDRSGERGPFVVVAHSAAATSARVVAQRRPKLVAGLVLVDPGAELDALRQTGPVWAAAHDAGRAAALRCIRATATGEMKPEAPIYKECGSPPMDGPLASRSMAEAVLSESESESHSRIVAVPGSLGAIPLIVLTAENKFTTREGAAPAETQPLRALWTKRGSELAALSTRGVQRVVPKASHVIQFEQPDAVVKAVGEVVAQVRAGATSPARVRR